MRFGRMFIVVVLVTMCGGLFGAVVGGLIGYAIPTTLDAFFLTQGASLKTDREIETSQQTTQDGNVRIGVNAESKMLTGAALGGAWGLILGSVIGLILGALDQIVLVFNRWCEMRKGTNAPVERRPV